MSRVFIQQFQKTLFLILSLSLLPLSSVAQTLTAREVFAKNLESIGSLESRAKLENLTVRGTYRAFLPKQNYETPVSKVQITSAAARFDFRMLQSSPVVVFHRTVFDGAMLSTRLTANKVTSWSSLNDFFERYEEIIKANLFAGTLNRGWGAIDLSGKQTKIDLLKEEVLNGRPVFVLRYSVKSRYTLKIKLYFDAQTFEHLHTEYIGTQSSPKSAPGRGLPGGPGGMPDIDRFGNIRYPPIVSPSSEPPPTRRVIYTVVEDFSDFMIIDGRNFPRHYEIHLKVKGLRDAEEIYKFDLNEFHSNRSLKPDFFTVVNN